MKKLKVLAWILALTMIFSMVAGCGAKESADEKDDEAKSTKATEPKKTDKNQESTESTESEKTETKEPAKNEQSQSAEGMQAVKIGSVEARSIYSSNSECVVYKADNGKYGIMSLDGKKDTGAKYVDYKSLGNYLQVTLTGWTESTDIAALNCFGVVDVEGKEIVPLQYATISELNERYIRVCEVTEQTENKDEALIYVSKNMFALTAQEGDLLFKGNWYIYDVIAGKKLEGATGTNGYSVFAYGDFVKYVTDAGETVVVNHKGEKLPEGADLFDNGMYALEKDGAGAVYDSVGNKLFDYDVDGFIPNNSTGEYIEAYKYVNNDRKYVLMDTSGRILTAEFDDVPFVYGELLEVDDKIYNFAGENVIEGTFAYVYDELFGNYWFLRNDKEYTLIQKDGTVVYQGSEDDGLSFDSYSNFYISKKVDDKNLYYCLADKDFTLEGSTFAPWMIKKPKTDGTYDIVDTITGKTVIKGYVSYTYAETEDAVIYVYAKTADGDVDIYTVK